VPGEPLAQPDVRGDACQLVREGAVVAGEQALDVVDDEVRDACASAGEDRPSNTGSPPADRTAERRSPPRAGVIRAVTATACPGSSPRHPGWLPSTRTRVRACTRAPAVSSRRRRAGTAYVDGRPAAPATARGSSVTTTSARTDARLATSPRTGSASRSATRTAVTAAPSPPPSRTTASTFHSDPAARRPAARRRPTSTAAPDPAASTPATTPPAAAGRDNAASAASQTPSANPVSRRSGLTPSPDP